MIKKGFTMIELLVVMAIIAIITGIGMGNYINTQAKTRDTSRKHALEQIQRALELYYNDNQHYPTDVAFPAPGAMFDSTDHSTIYIKEIPKDPNNPQIAIVYQAQGGGTGYILYAYLENDNDSCFATGGPCRSAGYSLDCGTASNVCNYAISSPNIVIP